MMPMKKRAAGAAGCQSRLYLGAACKARACAYSLMQSEVPGAKTRPAIADLSDAEGVNQLIQAVNGIDILVNNAGIYGPQDFYATDDATWERYWQTNVMSGVRLSRALLPAMVQKGWGRVVFIASESARNIPADMIHYGVTKTAQLSLARGLAKYVAGSGVTVNSVLPGPTLSDGFAEMMKDEVAKTGKSLEQLAKEFVMANRPSSVIQRAATVEADRPISAARSCSAASWGAFRRSASGGQEGRLLNGVSLPLISASTISASA